MENHFSLGDWVYGSKTGVGKFFYPNGVTQYHGDLSAGLAHGYGAMFYNNGNVMFKGKWHLGEFLEGKLMSKSNIFILTASFLSSSGQGQNSKTERICPEAYH